MQHWFHSGSKVLAAVIASYLIWGMAPPTLAQTTDTPDKPTLPAIPAFPLGLQLIAVDSGVNTVTLMEHKIVKTEVLAHGTRLTFAPGDKITVPIAPSTELAQIEHALRGNELEVNDVVSMLGQRRPAYLSRAGARGNTVERYNIKAEMLKVMAVTPLQLQWGATNSKKTLQVLRVPFNNGPNAEPSGTLTIATGADPDREEPLPPSNALHAVPVNQGMMSFTLSIDIPANVEFDRFKTLKILDIANALAAHLPIDVDTTRLPGGQLEVNRIRVQVPPHG